MSKKLGSILWLTRGDPEAHNTFYRSCLSLTSEKIWAMCDRMVTTTMSKSTGWNEDAKFKPLLVWANLGYPVATIEAKARPEDIRVCKVYGWDTCWVPEYSDHHGRKQVADDKLTLGKKTASSSATRKWPREEPVPRPRFLRRRVLVVVRGFARGQR